MVCVRVRVYVCVYECECVYSYDDMIGLLFTFAIVL